MGFADVVIFPAIFSIFIVLLIVLGIADLKADRENRKRHEAEQSADEHDGSGVTPPS